MAVNLSPVGGVAGQFFDNNGNPLVGGKLFTYAAGTTTPQVTYTSALGNTPNSNPIILNGGGRVPAEIWLTDGLEYKFVLYSSTDQLIGSWDNITGINSNFVNFVTSEEVQTATAGQTVFTLTTMAYQPGLNNLVVYVDGVNQIEGGAYSFVETSSTVVTFTNGLHVGALVKFVSAETLTGGATSADLVSYQPAGTGAVATNVQAKLRQTVSVKDFGAVGDGVTDDTAAIQAALTHVQQTNKWVLYFPEGIYLTSQTLDITKSEGNIVGSGSKTTVIRLTNDLAENFINISDPTRIFRIQASGFRLDSSVANIATGIRINNLSAGTFSDIDIFNLENGVKIEGYRPDGSSTIYLSNLTIRNLNAVTGKGIWINEAVDVFVDTCTINAAEGSEYMAAVYIENCQAAFFSNMDCLKAINGLHVYGNDSAIITWLFFNQVAFDKCANDGIRVICNDSGSLIKGLNFINCWSSTNGGRGVNIVSPPGVPETRLNGVRFVAHRAVNNVDSGVRISNCTDFSFSDGMLAGNSQLSPGTFNGIQVDADTNKFSLVGNRIGNTLGYTSTHGRNILVVAGTSSQYIIANNDINGFVTDALLDNGTGADKQIYGNLPVNNDQTSFSLGGTFAVKRILSANIIWDPATILAGGYASRSITVLDAEVGDVVTATLSSIGFEDFVISAVVAGANVVRVLIRNISVSSVDLPSGTLNVMVTKLGA